MQILCYIYQRQLWIIKSNCKKQIVKRVRNESKSVFLWTKYICPCLLLTESTWVTIKWTRILWKHLKNKYLQQKTTNTQPMTFLTLRWSQKCQLPYILFRKLGELTCSSGFSIAVAVMLAYSLVNNPAWNHLTLERCQINGRGA